MAAHIFKVEGAPPNRFSMHHLLGNCISQFQDRCSIRRLVAVALVTRRDVQSSLHDFARHCQTCNDYSSSRPVFLLGARTWHPAVCRKGSSSHCKRILFELFFPDEQPGRVSSAAASNRFFEMMLLLSRHGFREVGETRSGSWFLKQFYL